MRFILVFLLFSFNTLYAKIKLPALVGDNMVLQRDKPLNIWGWADEGEKIKVSFLGKTYNTVTPASKTWLIQLPALQSGGPFEMTISGNNSITLKNILIGDVWLCGGQSNMERRMSQVKDADKEIAAATNPNIHLFYTEHDHSLVPANDVKGSWKNCDPTSVRNFSAVAYFFAREIQPVIKVPIGLLESAYGGTAIEAWISPDALANEPYFGEQVRKMKYLNLDSLVRASETNFNKWILKVDQADPAYFNGKYNWAAMPHPDWPVMKLPSIFEDAVPSLDGKDGIVWFSKEFDLTEEDIKEDCWLNLAMIDDDDLTFVNNVKVGQSRDERTLARKYKVSKDILKPGKNFITIRVIDFMNNGGIYGKKEDMFLQAATRKIDIAGDWNYKMSLDTVFKKIYNKKFDPRRMPSVLYNAMMAPLTNYSYKGILFYQGEANAAKAYQYRSLFRTLIIDWRKQLHDPKLPFILVQLANYRSEKSPGESQWAELREAQGMILDLPNTGMATAVDIGEADNIHPMNKQEVGRRLALEARKIVYGEKKLLAGGPMFSKVVFKGDKAYLYFNDAGDGLKTSDGEKNIKAFITATGSGNNFQFAKAAISDKNIIEVTSPDGKPITSVRYAWADNPGAQNLVNSAGLPAYPFRTDKWKGMTYDKMYDK